MADRALMEEEDGEDPPETQEKTVTRTVVIPLEASDQKRQVVRAAFPPVRETMAQAADVLPSYPEREWHGQNTSLYRQLVKNRPDATRRVSLPDGSRRKVKSSVLLTALQKVTGAFSSWESRGKLGNRPSRDRFLEAEYLPINTQDIEIMENDRGYGLKTSFIAYNPVWFHFDTSPYHERFLARVVDEQDDAKAGSCEIHVDDETVKCHLTVSWTVPVYVAEDVPRYVGVRIGEKSLFTAAVVEADVVEEGRTDTSEGVGPVKMESGAKYRHYRERLRERRQTASEQGDLCGVKQSSQDFRRFTDQMCDEASRWVADFAQEHSPCAIRLADLENLGADGPQRTREWPYRIIQEQIAYKAEERQIPVEFVPAYFASQTCRKCGATDERNRTEAADPSFVCVECGYEVHQAVNSAFNLALGNPQPNPETADNE